MKVEARRKSSFLVPGLAVAGHRRHDGRLHARNQAQLARQRVAIHVGQADVEQAQVRQDLARAFDRIGRMELHKHFMPEQFDEHSQQARRIDVVIDHQDTQQIACGTGIFIAILDAALPVVVRQARQDHRHFAAHAHSVTLHRDGSAMQLHQAAHQRQADAQPALGSVGTSFALGEKLEGNALQFAGHADAVVAYAQRQMAVVHQHPQVDPAAVGRVPDGVAQHVDQHLDQPKPVAHHLGAFGRQLDVQLVRLGFEQGTNLLQRLGGNDFQVHRLLVQRHLAPGDAGNVEQIIDQARHVPGLARNHFAELPHPGFIQRAPGQQVRGCRNRRQRVPELMGQHGQELVLEPVRMLQALLRHLLLMNVGAGPDPADDQPLRIAHRPGTAQNPAVLARVVAQAVFALVELAVG